MLEALKKTIPLSKAIRFTVDNRGRTAPTSSNGIALIATNCVSNDALYPAYENIRYVSRETYSSWFRAHPKPGDILLTLKGSQNGAVCLVPDPVDFAIAQDMVALRADEAVIDPLFLFAALRSRAVQQQIKDLDVSGVIPHFKKSDFDKLLLPYPDRSTQTVTGELFFSICSKIDLNRRVNETLEAMARAIYKDWFIEFGPTRAKLEGRMPYLAPEILAFFPGRLDVEGKPEGWINSTLGEHVQNFDFRRVPVSGAERARRSGPFPYHGATGVMDHIDDYLFDGTFVLVGEDGSVVRENGLAFTQYVSGKFWVNNHAHVLQGKAAVSTEQLFMYFQHEHVTPYITGAVQLKLSQGRMNSMPFLFPGEAICKIYSELVSPLFAQLRSNAEESNILAQARDLVVPKLMSGEIRVKDAERVAEAVL
ncbi:type I restriction enzyme S subunit [Bradyrhizobium sp. USDA 4448]